LLRETIYYLLLIKHERNDLIDDIDTVS